MTRDLGRSSPVPQTDRTCGVSAFAPDRPGCELGAVADIELLEDVGEVDLDSRARDEHPLADLGVGEALGYELDDLGLGRGERFPAAGGPLARPARAPDPGDSLVERQRGSLGVGGNEGLVAELPTQCLLEGARARLIGGPA